MVSLTIQELVEVRNALNHILTDHDAKSQAAYAETRRAIQPVDQDCQQHESGGDPTDAFGEMIDGEFYAADVAAETA